MSTNKKITIELYKEWVTKYGLESANSLTAQFEYATHTALPPRKPSNHRYSQQVKAKRQNKNKAIGKVAFDIKNQIVKSTALPYTIFKRKWAREIVWHIAARFVNNQGVNIMNSYEITPNLVNSVLLSLNHAYEKHMSQKENK